MARDARDARDAWDHWKATEGQRWRTWWIERHPPEIGAVSWSTLFEGGKEIRPRLLCALWTWFGSEPCCAAGFVIECVHVATLILDDLPWMDDAAERRGRPTLHRVFSVRKALLLAAEVLEMAWQVIQETPWLRRQWESDPDRWRGWAREIAQGLWRGQWLDLATAATAATAYERAALKTGVLFEAVAKGVAWAHGWDAVWWGAWGRTVGVLFQWVDDADDREEDRRTGKPNAWNDDLHGTAERFAAEWRRVVQGAGGWWRTPFGERLYHYLSRPMGASVTCEPLTSATGLVDLWSSGPIETETETATETPTETEGLGIGFLRWFAPLFRRRPMDMAWRLDVSLWDKDETEWARAIIEQWPDAAPAIQWMERHLSAS